MSNRVALCHGAPVLRSATPLAPLTPLAAHGDGPRASGCSASTIAARASLLRTSGWGRRRGAPAAARCRRSRGSRGAAQRGARASITEATAAIDREGSREACTAPSRYLSIGAACAGREKPAVHVSATLALPRFASLPATHETQGVVVRRPAVTLSIVRGAGVHVAGAMEAQASAAPACRSKPSLRELVSSLVPRSSRSNSRRSADPMCAPARRPPRRAAARARPRAGRSDRRARPWSRAATVDGVASSPSAAGGGLVPPLHLCPPASAKLSQKCVSLQEHGSRPACRGVGPLSGGFVTHVHLRAVLRFWLAAPDAAPEWLARRHARRRPWTAGALDAARRIRACPAVSLFPVAACSVSPPSRPRSPKARTVVASTPTSGTASGCARIRRSLGRRRHRRRARAGAAANPAGPLGATRSRSNSRGAPSAAQSLLAAGDIGAVPRARRERRPDLDRVCSTRTGRAGGLLHAICGVHTTHPSTSCRRCVSSSVRSASLVGTCDPLEGIESANLRPLVGACRSAPRSASHHDPPVDRRLTSVAFRDPWVECPPQAGVSRPRFRATRTGFRYAAAPLSTRGVLDAPLRGYSTHGVRPEREFRVGVVAEVRDAV